MKTPKQLPANLDEAAEKYALKTFPKEEGKAFHSYFGTIEFDKNAGQREAFMEGFRYGAKWMAEQGITYKDKVMPTTDNSGNIDGYCLDGENEFAAVEAAVENGYLKVGDKVIVQIRKAE